MADVSQCWWVPSRTRPNCRQQNVPEELKSSTDATSEASLRGHLLAQGQEQTGSQSYVPPDSKNDKALLRWL
jgi:hypothetical protein